MSEDSSGEEEVVEEEKGTLSAMHRTPRLATREAEAEAKGDADRESASSSEDELTVVEVAHHSV